MCHMRMGASDLASAGVGPSCFAFRRKLVPRPPRDLEWHAALWVTRACCRRAFPRRKSAAAFKPRRLPGGCTVMQPRSIYLPDLVSGQETPLETRPNPESDSPRRVQMQVALALASQHAAPLSGRKPHCTASSRAGARHACQCMTLMMCALWVVRTQAAHAAWYFERVRRTGI